MSTTLQRRRTERVLRAATVGLGLVIIVVAVAATKYVSADRWVALALAIASCVLLSQLLRLRKNREQRIRQTLALGKQRLSALSNLAAALAGARTRADVASVVIEHGMRAAYANTCTLYILDATGKSLELIGQQGCAEEVVEKIRRISNVEGNPATFATLQSGQAVWAESEADYAGHYPELANTKADAPRAKAFWSMPLMVEAQAVGLLGMGFYQPRPFADDEREFVETLVKQCAQALWRAVRYEREDEARRWLNTTLVSIGDAVIATDSTGHITFMNRIAETLTGFGETEARGWPLERVFSIFAEKTGEPVENPVEKVLKEGAVVGLANHTLLRTKSGAEIPIDDSGAPIRSEDGTVLGVVLVFRDATRDKRERDQREFLAAAGEALVSSSLNYQATLATVARLAVPILADWCTVDLKESDEVPPYQAAVAHVEATKVQLARELGEKYPPDPNARQGVPEVIRTGKAELYREIPAGLIESAARDEDHLRMLRALKLKSAMVVPLRGRRRTLGAMTFIYAESVRRYSAADLEFVQSFADRAALAIENAIALRELEAARAEESRLRAESELASRAKDEFLAVVSHELRTPLNAILGWTVMMRRRNPTPELDRGLSIIERNARSQAKLIEDVLDISRIISGKLSLSLAATNIADALAAAVETVTPVAEGKGVRVVVEPHDRSLAITADPDRVQQIIWNLLSNAVKFTPAGGQVVVRAYRDGSNVMLVVHDDGEGIRAEVLPLIFDPFQQADASITRRHGGLGLGLAIVKQLVLAHGGTVRAESAGPGKGATFIVQLPARSAVPAVARSLRSTSSIDLSPPANQPDAPRLDGLRVLIVDDEQDALMLVSEVLGDRGAETYLAPNAAEAIDKVITVKPDVIVSDIGMPETDGYTMLRRIRSLPDHQGGGTPAVALTAFARADDAQRAFAAGFQMFVSKPIDPMRLLVAVAHLAGREAQGGR
jgi:PAS domain S-box-containing protein